MNTFKSKPNEYNLLSDATEQILSENYFEALACLHNCEQYIEKSHKTVNPYLYLTVMHNAALCFYRLQTNTQALDYLENCVKICKGLLKNTEKSANSLKLFRYLSHTHLRICAIFSQDLNHERALKHSKSALRCMKELLINTVLTISQYTLNLNGKKKLEYKMTETLGRITTALDKIISKKMSKRMKLYIGEDWVNNYSIGDIMSMKPILLSEWTAPFNMKQEITISNTIENICVLTGCYFSVATELRFLAVTCSADRSSTSKDWHERALLICKVFLPNSSPLFKHIQQSYEKHYIVCSKNPSPVVKSRYHSKRESEKIMTSSAKVIKKELKDAKSSKKLLAPRKPTPLMTRNLASTQKLNLKPSEKKRVKGGSGHLFSGNPIMATQKAVLESSDSEKCKFYLAFIFDPNFVLNSNDLYGDYSIKDEERESIIIKKIFLKDRRKRVNQVSRSKRILSSTGGKH